MGRFQSGQIGPNWKGQPRAASYLVKGDSSQQALTLRSLHHVLLIIMYHYFGSQMAPPIDPLDAQWNLSLTIHSSQQKSLCATVAIVSSSIISDTQSSTLQTGSPL